MIIDSSTRIITAIGTMSGTSCDGVDVALIRTDGEDKIECLDTRFLPYPEQFAHQILETMSSDSNLKILKLESALTIFHAEAINAFLASMHLKAKQIDIVGFHGQTMLHLPADSITQQVGNPHLLAELIDINVISDFRRRDIAAGGQGAPLTPLFHKVISHQLNSNNVIFLNIGGITNITCISNNKLIASLDIGPGNAPINDLVKRRMGLSYDEDGAIAAGGEVNNEFVRYIMSDEFFSQPLPKSLDRNHFDKYILDHLSVPDAAATLCKVIALSLKAALAHIKHKYDILLLCGGGRKNVTIIKFLQEEFGRAMNVVNIDDLGIDGCFVEAYAFGYLAVRSLLNKTISYPSTTGVKKEMSGGSITLK